MAEDKQETEKTFADLGLCKELVEACENLGWKKPTKIQEEAIPHALQGKDLIGVAATGSGKTGAFVLPTLEALLKDSQERKSVQPFFVCVLSPTRELAIQIAEQFEALGSGIGVKCVVLVGGEDMLQQSIVLAKKRPHIIVGTPGRLADHLSNTKGFSLHALKYLILDEADRLLSMDFEKSLDEILKAIPKNRRTYLFSATMTNKVKKLQRACLRNPVKIEAAFKYSTVDTLEQGFYFMPATLKDCYLVYLLSTKTGATSMIFTRTCRETDFLALVLRKLGLEAIPINGQMSQSNRLGALNKGLDIPSVDVVVNYNIPTNSKDYFHRVGRTARAGRSGLAISLVNQFDIGPFTQIEKHIGDDFKIPKYTVNEDEVLLLAERVTEAKRISRKSINESGNKRTDRLDEEDEEDIEKYLGIKNKKESKKLRRNSIVSTLERFWVLFKAGREEKIMKNRRVEEDNMGSEESGGVSKRQRLDEQFSASGIENPLVPYNDVDDEEEDFERGKTANGGGKVEENRGQVVAAENGEEEEEEEEEDLYGEDNSLEKRKSQFEPREDCPYLDTVNRQVLDFDFEKFCSVSLSNLNVYACLVCGKYYQGRGKKSHAYTHSLEAGHHVYVNLRTEKVYCLPDGYEIIDPSLDDIRHVLNPRFTRDQVKQLDKNRQWSRALDGSDYLPGMVGLNNIKETDFVNVTIQSLMRVTPLRNFFLIPENYQHCKSPLVQRYGELTRKIWHARNFKGQVSPHEFLQAVMKASKKRFRIGQQSDPLEFMAWLLNTLHANLRTSKKNNSIIYECFQGELEVVKEIPNKAITEKKENGDIFTETSRMPFLMLGLDLPPPPLFKDVMEKNIIPQVPLFNILKKFDGETVTEVVRPRVARMKYRVIRLPQYLILHMQRFKKNNFFIEKNPTLVNFPVKNLELKDFIPLPMPKEIERLRSKYDLIANIVHDGKPNEGFYRVFVQRKSEELWYEMQDLHVSETLPQMVALSEAYLQIYEQQQ
ncbi:hypothetical protein OIU85_000131 [Salix viminalis]|uniref:RNA helicase n=1 Tax=Salix viminalis TaxID=40686 RepID=A0A9Q0ZWG1_SALVM|nr:hypothetical protein OIU85_000131 [Salix viminalis]